MDYLYNLRNHLHLPWRQGKQFMSCHTLEAVVVMRKKEVTSFSHFYFNIYPHIMICCIAYIYKLLNKFMNLYLVC